MMNLNSPLFDRVRVKSRPEPEVRRPDVIRCDSPGCSAPGEFRAPMGRDREGEYFCFCLDHVREYNASYNYFNGMSAEALARYQRDAAVGHRPTWAVGQIESARAAFRHKSDDPSRFDDPMGLFGHRRTARAQPEPKKRQLGIAARKALDQLGLDETADAETIRSRYKNMVKRLHPDANGGDRSLEDKLREIIRAYNYLKSVKLA
ncbi:MAG TPA: DnaJ domain-containing protein [Methylovirgula sp.]